MRQAMILVRQRQSSWAERDEVWKSCIILLGVLWCVVLCCVFVIKQQLQAGNQPIPYKTKCLCVRDLPSKARRGRLSYQSASSKSS